MNPTLRTSLLWTGIVLLSGLGIVVGIYSLVYIAAAILAGFEISLIGFALPYALLSVTCVYWVKKLFHKTRST